MFKLLGGCLFHIRHFFQFRCVWTSIIIHYPRLFFSVPEYSSSGNSRPLVRSTRWQGELRFSASSPSSSPCGQEGLEVSRMRISRTVFSSLGIAVCADCSCIRLVVVPLWNTRCCTTCLLPDSAGSATDYRTSELLL
jgi:hypothetical protein